MVGSRKKFLSLCFAFVLVANCLPVYLSNAADINYQWSKRLGGTALDWGYSTATDLNGNVIIGSYVTGNADLNGDGDNTDGGAESATGYANYDGAISVFNSSGTHQWSKRLGGINYDHVTGVSADLNGNIVAIGNVVGNADLNGDGDSTDGGAESATGYGANDIYISVFNSSGTYQWSKRLGSTVTDSANSVTTDLSGNIIVIGNVYGNADLNGDGDSTDGGAESATGYGSADHFITVFNSSGTYQWSKRLGGINYDTAYGVATDTNNNVIIVGSVNGNADFNGDGDSTDGGAESATGYANYDGSISVFNSSGTYQWSKRLGGTDSDFSKSISTDDDGNITVVGYINGNADLNGDGDSTDAGGESATGYGLNDVFTTTFNSSGTYQWSARLGGAGSDYGRAVATSSNGYINITGTVSGNADLNGDGDSTDGGAESSTGYGNDDGFLSVFDSSGIYQWSKRLGSIDLDSFNSISTDSNGSIVLTGIVSGNADLNSDGDSTDGGAESSTGYGSYDIFVSVFSAIYNTTPTLASLSAIQALDGSGETSITAVVNDADNDNLSISYHYEAGACGAYGAQPATTITSATDDSGALTITSNQPTAISTALADNTVVAIWDTLNDIPDVNGTYCLYAFANDGTTNSSVASTTVALVSNTAPTDISLSAASVDENVALGTTVGTLSTTDTEGGAMTYSLVAGTGDTDNASFTISGSTLQTNTALDFETKSSYSVRIQTEDSGALTYAEAFTITVNDVVENVAPVLSSASAVAPNGNGDVNISVVVNDDDDDNLTISYYYEAGSCSSYSSQPAPTLRSASDGAGSVTVSSGTATSVATTSADNTLVAVWDTVADFGDTRGDYCVYIIANDGSVDSNEVSATVNISGSGGGSSDSGNTENEVNDVVADQPVAQDSDTNEEGTAPEEPTQEVSDTNADSQENSIEQADAFEEESSNQDSGFEAPVKTTEIAEKFKDVVGTWAESYIDKLREKGLFADIATETKPGETKTESAFVPDAPVKRGELIKMSMQAFGHKVPKSSSSTFSDVKSGSEYVSYIEAAKKAGYIKGYSDGTFHPDESVNRVEALAIILKISGVKLDFEEKFVFPDTDANAWYADFISYAVEHKIISGYKNGNFGPNDKLTRSQAAKVLVLVMERL